MKQGYYWAKTSDGALFIVLNVDGGGFVPGREDAIDLGTVTILEPVKWPSQVEAASRVSGPLKCGAPAVVAAPGCVILPFVANG